MKNILTALVFVAIINSDSAISNAQNISAKIDLPVPASIDQYDSVFFDISAAVINGTSVEFPVSLRSDDIINALDFSFKYNQSHLEYDTIINLTNYIEPLSYYNPNDSTVRLTSYSFTQPYSNDTPLVIIRFNIISGNLCASDLDSLTSLLNGDASAYGISDCVTGAEEVNQHVIIPVFPNPASETIQLNIPDSDQLEVFDVLSHEILLVKHNPMDSEMINVTNFPNGNYIVKVTGNKKVYTGRFVICR